MLYLKCPTCKKLLGDIQLIYEKILAEITKDREMNKITEDQANDYKAKLANSFGVDYCCKTRLLTYIRLADIII